MTIGERFAVVREKVGMSPSEFAEKLEIQKSMVSEIENNKREVSKGVLITLMNKCSVSVDWLLTGAGSMFVTGDVPSAGTSRIPLLRQSVSCGPGQEWGDADNVEEYISQPLDLVAQTKGRRIYAFRVSGTSMAGAGISDGDIIFFDGTPTDDYTDDLYVFALDGKVYCKLVKFDEISRRVELYSMHTPDIEKAELIKTIDSTLPEAQKTLHIFGRVFAWLHENRMMGRRA